jgi:hypothetical protein
LGDRTIDPSVSMRSSSLRSLAQVKIIDVFRVAVGSNDKDRSEATPNDSQSEALAM